MKIKVWESLGFVGADREDSYNVSDFGLSISEWRSMSEDEKEDVIKEFLYHEWGWYEEEVK